MRTGALLKRVLATLKVLGTVLKEHQNGTGAQLSAHGEESFIFIKQETRIPSFGLSISVKMARELEEEILRQLIVRTTRSSPEGVSFLGQVISPLYEVIAAMARELEDILCPPIA